jgi:hypothetical protein
MTYRDLNPDKLDRWITGNWGEDSVYGGRELPSGVEDLLGEKVVVGTNDYGLGRWGTIVSWEEWEDCDEDWGRYGGITLLVEFNDGGEGSISMTDAEEQLRRPRKSHS